MCESRSPGVNIGCRLRPLMSLCFLLTACSLRSVPLPAPIVTRTPPSAQATATPEEVQQIAPVVTPSISQIVSPTTTYAVVWVPEGESLAVHKPAGISSSVIDTLASDQRAISLTGYTSLLGSSLWVELVRPVGGTGWVNFWNLTEDVPSTAFCDDPDVAALLVDFVEVMKTRDGEGLGQLVNPRRGLIVRHDWWNPEVIFRPPSIPSLFSDPESYAWGSHHRENVIPIQGSFRDVILPQLEDVFEASPEGTCNSLTLGDAALVAGWPAEYSNLNYVAFHRPAPEEGSRFDWRTWALGIEFLHDRPYLTVLVQFRGEI